MNDESDFSLATNKIILRHINFVLVDECRSSKDCDYDWMCNFDKGITGSCEDCDYFRTVEECYDTGFNTETGTLECITQCTTPVTGESTLTGTLDYPCNDDVKTICEEECKIYCVPYIDDNIEVCLNQCRSGCYYGWCLDEAALQLSPFPVTGEYFTK